jgi:ABC-type branched-subunit amino acid transport system permease subunit
MVRHVDLRQSDEEPRVLPAPARRSVVSAAAQSDARARVNVAPSRHVLAAAGFGVAVLLPLFLDQSGIALHNLILAAAYVIMALGLNVVVGFAGLLDLGYVAFYAIGAHVTAHFGSAFWGIHLNFLLILVLAVLATAIAGLLIGLPTLRLRGDYIAIVTLAFGEIIGEVVSNGRQIQFLGGSLTGGPNGMSAIDRIDLPFLHRFGLLDLRPWYWFALALVALVLVVNVRLRDSRVERGSRCATTRTRPRAPACRSCAPSCWRTASAPRSAACPARSSRPT